MKPLASVTSAARAVRRHVRGQRLGCKPHGDDLSDWRRSTCDWRFEDMPLGDARGTRYNPEPVPRIWQGRASSCVLHTLTQAANVYELRRGMPHRQRSRRAGYALSRSLHKAVLIDAGTYHRTALEAWRRWGLPLEEEYPYSTAFHKVNRLPPWNMIGAGHDRRGLEWYWVNHPDPAERLRQVKAALRADLAVGFGFNVHSAYMRNDGPGIIDGGDFVGPIEGGHSQLLYGPYDDNEELLGVDQWWQQWRRHVPYTSWRYDTFGEHARDIFVMTLPEGRMAA